MNREAKLLVKTSQALSNLEKEVNNGYVGNAYLVSSSDEDVLERFLVEASRLFLKIEKEVDDEKVLETLHPNLRIFGFDKGRLDNETILNIINQTFLSREIDELPKVICIYDLSKAERAMQNKLLKTIEEVQNNQIILIGTMNKSYVLDTIKSRCRSINIEKFSFDKVKSVYKNEDPEKLKVAYDFASSNLTIIDKVLRDEEFYQLYSLCEDIFLNMLTTKDIMSFYKRYLDIAPSDAMLQQKKEYGIKILEIFEVYTHLLIDNIENQSSNDIMNKIISRYSLRALSCIADNILLAYDKLKANVDGFEVFKSFLYKLLEDRYKCLQ